MNALRNNLPTFVYEFLELGIEPSEIFFPENQFFEGETRYKELFSSLYDPDLIVCYISENKKKKYLSFIPL